jgi:predicted DCC family thiol-disulfide oxidoreductase YuxK
VAELPTPWRWLHAFDVLPAVLLDLLYRAFARVRYRVFGRMDACRVPSADERARILP